MPGVCSLHTIMLKLTDSFEYASLKAMEAPTGL